MQRADWLVALRKEIEGEIFSVIFTIDDYAPDGYNRYINGFYGVIVISALNVEKRWLVQTV